MAGRPPPPRYVQLRTATRGEPDRGQGSRTITAEQDDDPQEGGSSAAHFDGVLSLRGGPTHGNRVTWQEGTVDNEFLNRKKSKICCIFHKSKPKNFEDPFADSSSSSSSDGSSSEESDTDAEGGQCDGCGDCSQAKAAQRSSTPGSPKGKERADRNHICGESSMGEEEGTEGHPDHEHTVECSRKSRKHKHTSHRIKPNAYERQPKYGKAKKKRDKGSSTMTVIKDTDPSPAQVQASS